MKLRGTIATIAAAAALAAVPAAVPAQPAAGPTAVAAKTCRPHYKHAWINGAEKCLQPRRLGSPRPRRGVRRGPCGLTRRPMRRGDR